MENQAVESPVARPIPEFGILREWGAFFFALLATFISILTFYFSFVQIDDKGVIYYGDFFPLWQTNDNSAIAYTIEGNAVISNAGSRPFTLLRLNLQLIKPAGVSVPLQCDFQPSQGSESISLTNQNLVKPQTLVPGETVNLELDYKLGKEDRDGSPYTDDRIRKIFEIKEGRSYPDVVVCLQAVVLTADGEVRESARKLYDMSGAFQMPVPDRLLSEHLSWEFL